MSDIDPEKKPTPEPDDDTRPLTGEPVAPMRLRAEPPRVTRLSRQGSGRHWPGRERRHR